MPQEDNDNEGLEETNTPSVVTPLTPIQDQQWFPQKTPLLKNGARNSQFDFPLNKLRKFEFPHQQTTWRPLTFVTWLTSHNLLIKFKLDELEFS